MFVKGKTLGSLAASSLAVDRTVAWEAKDLSSGSTLSLSVCLALSKDCSSLTHLLPSHLVNEAEAQ